ncbi:hypothetical protein J2125_003921 [Erwinia toletana]|uniref:Uncharacterized protein n=1 Tax=Winslowiella toletana TaxID=92490 RepID=A0ABS4PDL6_9GAMM|nr:hypothetical protein [Winslowiella toletana]MBP2170729.1 hypothetical protein [Winslowiella toletana]
MPDKLRHCDLILLVLISGLSTLLLLCYHNLSKIRTQTDHLLAEMQQRINQLENRPQPDLQTFNQRINALRVYQPKEILNHTKMLNELKNSNQALQSSLAEVQKEVAALKPPTPPQAAVIPLRRPPATTPRRAAMAPFTLEGVEYRAGIALAVIMPLHGRNIDQTILLRIGEHWHKWQLININGQWATFVTGKVHLKLHAPVTGS